MPRPAITDMKVVFRVDSQLHAWFKAYCQQKGTTMSEMYRAWMLSLKREAERLEPRDGSHPHASGGRKEAQP